MFYSACFFVTYLHWEVGGEGRGEPAVG